MPEDTEGKIKGVEIPSAARGQPPREVDRVGGHVSRSLCAGEIGQFCQRGSGGVAGLGSGAELPEVDTGAFEGVVWLDIADDRQDGVVRQVVAPEEVVNIIESRCV